MDTEYNPHFSEKKLQSIQNSQEQVRKMDPQFVKPENTVAAATSPKNA